MNKDLWAGKRRVKYSTPASRLWVEQEIRKLVARVEVLKHQNTRIVNRINQVLVARKHYDTVTVSRRAARDATRIEIYRRMAILWRAYERGRAEIAPTDASPDSKKPA